MRAGGKPSTWFPPEKHVDQDAIVETFSYIVKKMSMFVINLKIMRKFGKK